MGKTALELTPEERRTFQPAEVIHRRKLAHQEDLAMRRDRALELAKEAAGLLKSEFGAERVVVFGSLAREGWFTPWSDVDLAAWGIPSSRFFGAVAALTDLSNEMDIDLVDPESCSHGLKETIEREGIEL